MEEDYWLAGAVRQGWYLAVVLGILRMAHDEWQWLDNVPKIRLFPVEVERDRWLTQEEAQRLITACPPHLATEHFN